MRAISKILRYSRTISVLGNASIQRWRPAIRSLWRGRRKSGLWQDSNGARQASSAGQSGVVSWNGVFFGNPPIDFWLAPRAQRLIDLRERLAAEETVMRRKR